MSLTLLANPDKILHTIVSNVNAGITQLPYTFKRTDFGGTSNPQGGVDYVSGAQDRGNGNIEVVFEAALGDVVSDWPSGETIYYESATIYKGIYTIVDTRFSGGTTRIQLGSPFISNDFSALQIINKISERPDYSANVIFEDLTNSIAFAEQVFVYQPSQAGDLFFDFGGVVTTYLENLSVTSLQYRIQYRENYTGIDDAYLNDVEIQCLLAERGIGQVLGSNMWEKMLKLRGQFQQVAAQESQTLGLVEILIEEDFNGVDATDVDLTGLYEIGQLVTLSGFTVEPSYNGQWRIRGKRFNTSFSRFVIDGPYVGNDFGSANSRAQIYDRGKFMTHFVNPKYWKGWNIGVTFLADTNYLSRNGSTTIEIQERGRDQNNNNTGAIDQFSYADDPARLQEHTIIDDDQVITQTANINMRALNNSINELYAELNFTREDECKNPIMVTWLNSLGAAEYYLFNIAQDVILSADAGLVYEPAVTADVSELHDPLRRINSDETLQLILLAENVPLSNIRALHEIKTAEVVRVYLSKDGVDFVGVTVNTAFTTGYNTDDHTTDFTVAIDFPKDYDFFSIKSY